MNESTARNRLVKLLLFDFVKKTNLDTSYRCGEKIINVGGFSIDHKESWLYNSIDSFWDLDNIAYSHKICNSIEPNKRRKKKGPPGASWCYSCERFLPVKGFSKRSSRWNDLARECKKCRHTRYLNTRQ